MPKDIDIAEARRLIVEEGLTRAQAAKRLGIGRHRFCAAITRVPRAKIKDTTASCQRLTRYREEQIEASRVRYRLICEEARKGDKTTNSLARSFGVERKTIWRALQEDEIARRLVAEANNKLPRDACDVQIPGWVPERLHDDFRLIAEDEGEEAAASWARNAKRNRVLTC